MTEPVLRRLSGISTSWSMLAKAHASGDEAVMARRLLCERYQGAVRRYAHAVLRDAPSTGSRRVRVFLRCVTRRRAWTTCSRRSPRGRT